MSDNQKASGVESRVCADIAGRQRVGIEKYGVTLENAGLSLREALQHQYEELLDAACYVKLAIEKLDEAGE